MESEKIESGRKQHSWRRVKRYGPVLVWMAVIFFASTGEFSGANTSRIVGPLLRWLFPSISEEQIALAHFIIRKTAHFIGYAILGWLAALAFTTSSRPAIRRRWFLVSLTLVVLYALSDEYHQTFVHTRTPSLYDSFIDMVGGLAALVVYALRLKNNAKKKKER